MMKDSGVELTALKVDGGMTSNNLLMQTLSDFLDAPVVRPMVAETTCLGAAYAARPGRRLLEQHRRPARQLATGRRVDPRMDADTRDREYKSWLKAVERTMGWLEDEE